MYTFLSTKEAALISLLILLLQRDKYRSKVLLASNNRMVQMLARNSE